MDSIEVSDAPKTLKYWVLYPSELNFGRQIMSAHLKPVPCLSPTSNVRPPAYSELTAKCSECTI